MILVGGESLIDLIVYPGGRLAAISGGGPFNTARTIGRLGGSSAYLGRLSTDRFGRALLDRLVLDGVDCRLVQSTDDPTTLAVAELDASGAATYHFYVEGTSAPGLSNQGLADGLPTGTSALHVGTLGLVLEPMGTTLESLVRGAPDDVVVMVDPNCRPSATPDPGALRSRVQRLAGRADVIKASHDDLGFLYPGTAADTAAGALLEAGPSAILVTDGGKAVRIVARGGAAIDLPVAPVDVVDTVGAGDAFGGAFLTSWIERGLGRADLADPERLRSSVEFAIRVASETCRRAGAEPPTAAEIAGSV
jgi:fructokinase